MNDAKSCPIIFLYGEIGAMSSFAPIRKIMTKEARIYCKSPNISNGVHMIMEKMTPAKMPMPPKEGVITVWECLSVGTSTKFLSFATLIIEGIAKKVSVNAVIKLKMTSYIIFQRQF